MKMISFILKLWMEKLINVGIIFSFNHTEYVILVRFTTEIITYIYFQLFLLSCRNVKLIHFGAKGF